MNAVMSERVLTCIAAPVPVCYDLVLASPFQQVIKQKTTDYYDVFVYGGFREGVADAEVLLAVSSLAVLARSSTNSSTYVVDLPLGAMPLLHANSWCGFSEITWSLLL